MIKLIFIAIGIHFIAFNSFAASGIELTCKAKAKEIAATTYRGCVTEAKTVQIESLKKEYQEKLHRLKAKYEAELKKLGGAKVAKNKVDETPASSDMSVQLKPIESTESTSEESVMDIPEPLPTDSSL